MVGAHAQPKPSQNLEKQGLISSPGKISPYRGKVPENLRQLQEGREQGVRRPSQHSLRRDSNALIHEQRPQHTEHGMHTNMHVHSTPPNSKVNTAACTRHKVQTHPNLYMACPRTALGRHAGVRPAAAGSPQAAQLTWRI